jgi:hypothetical protein
MEEKKAGFGLFHNDDDDDYSNRKVSATEKTNPFKKRLFAAKLNRRRNLIG